MKDLHFTKNINILAHLDKKIKSPYKKHIDTILKNEMINTNDTIKITIALEKTIFESKIHS